MAIFSPPAISSAAAAAAYDIANSARFDSASSSNLDNTFSSVGSTTDWTLSFWMKRSKISTRQCLFHSKLASGNNNDSLNFETGSFNQLVLRGDGSGILQPSMEFKDPAAWYHIVIASDLTNATNSLKVRMYVNGSEITDFVTDNRGTYPSGNTWSFFNAAELHRIGEGIGTGYEFDGYFAEWYFIDDQVLTPSDFGETDGTYGHWKAKAYSGSYGTNGFYLPFDGTGTKHTITSNGNTHHETDQSKIGGSSIQFDGTGDYLSVPDHSTLDIGTGDFTVEMYLRIPSVTASYIIMSHGGPGWSGNTNGFSIPLEAAGNIGFNTETGGARINSDAHGMSVDTWHHVAVVRDSGTIRFFVDGVAKGSTANSDDISSTAELRIGVLYDNTTGIEFTGYMDEIRISNNARYTTGFTPSTTAFTDDANTVLLIHSDTTDGSTTFTDSSGVEGALGNDQSGNANHWTENNISLAEDQMLDSPTNNFCTLNPLDKHTSGISLTEGNLEVTGSASYPMARGSIFASSGKWYVEVCATDILDNGYLGVGTSAATLNSASGGVGVDANGWGLRWDANSHEAYHDGTYETAYSGTPANNDIYQIAFDVDAGKVWWGKNGTWFASGDPGAGTNAEYTNLGSEVAVMIGGGHLSNPSVTVANFGQDSSFAGAKTAQGNADDNGYGDFYYSPPTGFLALCTKNLDEPTVVPSEHFTILTHTGTESSLDVTGADFQPDFVWGKSRSYADWHTLMDAVRGTSSALFTNANNAEDTASNRITAFNSDGFTLGTDHTLNTNTETYVDWCWKANGAGTANSNGSISSTVSANTAGGISIVSYTGNVTNSTVGHGLSQTPEMMVVKNRDSSQLWATYHKDMHATPEDYYIDFGSYGSRLDNNTRWNDTAPTSTVFSIGTDPCVNGSGHDMIAYCFHSVPGFSKVGGYTGNANVDGTFVYTGFNVRYLMLKDLTGGNLYFMVFDSERTTYNLTDDHINVGATSAEQVGVSTRSLDLLSNGFKFRDAYAMNYNADYIYVAFAEHPFKYTNAR
jgi:hypothetical protein